MRRFEGRVAVVTGAASGIGEATAKALAARGCRLALADVDAERLEAVGEALAADGVTVSRHRVDVADADQMESFAEAVRARHGGANVVVNNAGVTVAARFEEHSLEDLEWIIGINLWGVIHGCRCFLPLLREAEEGHIVNVSSLFGFIGVPTQASYCATKFAVRGLSEALWVELRDAPIGVTSIHPGGIATRIAESMRGRDASLRTATVDALARSRPPEAVARAIVRSIEKDRLRARVGIETVVGEWLKRLMPVGSQKLLARRMADFGNA